MVTVTVHPTHRASRSTPGMGRLSVGLSTALEDLAGKQVAKQTAIQERRATLGPDPGHVLGDTDPS